jgi:hypothetical protein
LTRAHRWRIVSALEDRKNDSPWQARPQRAQ